MAGPFAIPAKGAALHNQLWLTLRPFVMHLLHINLKIPVINFACIAIDDDLVKIYQPCVLILPDYQLCSFYPTIALW